MRYLILIAIAVILSPCSKEKVFTDYQTNETRIDSLARYFHSIRPDNLDVLFQFGEEENIDILIWDNRKEDELIYDKFGLKFNSYDLDSILKSINLNQNILIELKQSLNKINCKSIGYKHEVWRIHNSVGAIEIGYKTDDYFSMDYLIIDTIEQNFLAETKQMCNFKNINTKVLVRFSGCADNNAVDWRGE